MRSVRAAPLSVGATYTSLLPPSLVPWVPEGHLLWTILGAVGALSLSEVYGA